MTAHPLLLEYSSPEELAGRADSWWIQVLGVVGYEKVPQPSRDQIPMTASMTPPLRTADALCEVWRVAAGTVRGSSGPPRPGRVHYRHCDEVSFGSIIIDERALGDGSAGLLQATAAAYADIFTVLAQTGHHLVRVWNYLPEINREIDGDERYRHFNAARQAAFRDSGRRLADTVPAASALGSPPGSPISIYFLAASVPPRMIENPRQTSAYHYPAKFGRHSPLFSRACVLRDLPGTNLFVSGTASILGHETMHHGDVAAQTRQSVANIDSLLGEANHIVGAASYSLDRLKLKVYVRRPSDLPLIEETLAALVNPAAPIVYLQADVCREDLLVEIEATGDLRSTSIARPTQRRLESA